MELLTKPMVVLMSPWVASCDETRDHLSDHLEGELTGREQKRVLRRLLRCRQCRAVLESLGRTLDHLRSLGQVQVLSPAPIQTADAVVERIRHDRR